MELRFGQLWNLFIGVAIALMGICYGQMDKPICTSDMEMAADGCVLNIETMSNILKDYYDGKVDRVDFCRNKFERCVQAVQTAGDHKCEIHLNKQKYHGQVDALRGFCQDIDAWESHKSCVIAQLGTGGLAVCQLQYYNDQQNFSRTEFTEGHYASDYARRNARCKLHRSFQECNEDVIYAQCRDYYYHFKEYQVALLTPYCRQLYQLTSRYVTDDPNTAVFQSSVSFCIITTAVFVSGLISRFL